MEKDPSRLHGALEFLRASQQLERIGDLSTNISEEVVFLVEGCSIKHNLERRADRARPVLP
jgi:phosphate transport system protein